MNPRTVTLDVREDIRNGREPFGKIMQTVAGLKDNEQLRLIAPFEPAPLYAVLGATRIRPQVQAYARRETSRCCLPAAQPTPPSRKPPLHAPSRSPGSTPRSCTGTPVIEVDARGLEPPQPLVKILEALATLPEGARLRARTDRRPMHLYAQLEERGFVGESEEQKDGSFVTNVRRR